VTNAGAVDSVKSLIADIKINHGTLQEDDEIAQGSAQTEKISEAMETFLEGMDGFVRWPEIEGERYPSGWRLYSGRICSRVFSPFNTVILTLHFGLRRFSRDLGVLGLENSESCPSLLPLT
jgi:hypothetical protein